MGLNVGQAAPDFELPDENGNSVRLSDFKGKKVFLVFYAADWSSICTSEMNCLRDDLPKFGGKNVQILGISVDNIHSHAAWKATKGYQFPLLSDFWPHGGVARKYGIFDEKKGLAKRGAFVIDEKGIIKAILLNEVTQGRTEEEFLRLLDKAS